MRFPVADSPRPSPAAAEPAAVVTPPPTLAQAQAYCRQLARRHYENFTVASWLLPRPMRQHFCNIYAYCRWADDLADEHPDARRNLQRLDGWQHELEECYAGRPRHPVFVALSHTIAQYQLPRRPLLDLLVAFRQDQTIREYQSLSQVLDYCRYSANPVGELILYLGRCHGEQTRMLSDEVCTGLQLVNFWQDVARDWAAGRVYLPQDLRERFGYSHSMLQQRLCNPAFRELISFLVQDAERHLQNGWPLVSLVPRPLRGQIALFLRGGLAVAAAIRRQQFDVWSARPVIHRGQKLRWLLATWCRSRCSWWSQP